MAGVAEKNMCVSLKLEKNRRLKWRVGVNNFPTEQLLSDFSILLWELYFDCYCSKGTKRGHCSLCWKKKTDAPWLCSECGVWLCHSGCKALKTKINLSQFYFTHLFLLLATSFSNSLYSLFLLHIVDCFYCLKISANGRFRVEMNSAV